MPRRKTDLPTASASTASAATSGDSIALRAFSILEHVARARVSQSLDDITQAMNLPKPTVFRILNMLHGTGLLLKEPATKRYSAGPRLTAFAIDLWHNRSLREPWRRALEYAVANTGESCNLTMLENSSVLYLDRVETTQPLRLNLESGSRVPLHCTASGKLFLAMMPAAQRKALIDQLDFPRMTANTLTDAAALRAECALIAEQGHSSDREEFIAGLVAVAVPVRDAQGVTRAALAVHGPTARFSSASANAALPALHAAAERMGSLL